MAKFKACVDKASKKANGNYFFKCPATNRIIEVSTRTPWSPNQIAYGFNQDVDAPTLTPAVMLIDGKDVGKSEFDIAKATTVNHFIIQDGNIRYLENSTHQLKGRTVPLPQL